MGAGVLLAWQHGGNLGHLGRLLLLARALHARGERVSFAVADAAAAARFIAPAGFAWTQAPDGLEAAAGAEPVVNHADILLRCGFGQATQAAAVIHAWQALFSRVDCSVLVADAAPLALYAAHAAGLRAVALGHGFEIPPAKGPRPVFTPWLPEAAGRAEQAEALLGAAMEGLADGLQQDKAPRSIGQLFDPAHVALCTWPELDHVDRPPNEQRYTGPLWAAGGEHPAHGFRERAGPRVLAYLNLVDKRHDLVWQALQGHGANVTVLSPGGAAWACEAARGWGVEVLDRPVDLGPLLSEADAVITHGGMGLCSMALRAAKPLLVLPENTEQAVLAYRLSRQGLAMGTLRLRDRVKVRQKVEALLAGGGTAGGAVAALAAKYCAYQPEDAARALAARLMETGKKKAP